MLTLLKQLKMTVMYNVIGARGRGVKLRPGHNSVVLEK